MPRKIAFFVIYILFITSQLTSCYNGYNMSILEDKNANFIINNKKFKYNNGMSITEDSNYIYFAVESCIYKVDKSFKHYKILNTDISIETLQYYNDRLYFTDYNRNIIYSITSEGKDLSIVLNNDSLDVDCELYKYFIENDILFLIN